LELIQPLLHYISSGKIFKVPPFFRLRQAKE